MIRLFGRRKKPSRVLVLGLDCAGPQLVFDEFKDDLPVLNSLARQGIWGELESCIPCITIPAWASMMSSRDPGVLGCYGFRNRTGYAYDSMAIANATTIKAPRVWDHLSAAGHQSVVLAVPQTYPVRALTGHMVSGLLTPGTESAFTYPAIFKHEVLKVAPNYRFDVNNFRTTDKTGLLQQIIDLTEIHYKLVSHCLKNKSWDFLMHVNIGVDRIHHGFWRYHDPQHRLYEQNHPLKDAIREYYKLVDAQIGQLLEITGDDVTVLVVSDHGVKRMDGGICVNEWLRRTGWLALKTAPKDGEIAPLEQVEIDWSRTKAWASGGYYGRVFLNVRGREPQGIIHPEQYSETRDELAAALANIPDPDGRRLNTQVFNPEDIYTQVNNFAPDLMVYFGDLHWRAVGSLGHANHYTLENDTGPDDANHAQNGLFILYQPGQKPVGQVHGQQLMNIAPTVLHHLGVAVPPEMQGQRISF